MVSAAKRNNLNFLETPSTRQGEGQMPDAAETQQKTPLSLAGTEPTVEHLRLQVPVAYIRVCLQRV